VISYSGESATTVEVQMNTDCCL